MLKLLSLLLFSNAALSFEYVSLNDNKVYDIEIIVFAYDTPLPEKLNYKNNPNTSIQEALLLGDKPEDLPFIKQEPEDKNEELTLPIDSSNDDKNPSQALIWFNHHESYFKLNHLWNKLLKNPSTTPLLHRSWRQTPSEFNNPVYVNLVDKEENEVELNENFANDENTEVLIDYLLDGKVAFSKGRFLHFGHDLNLQRTYSHLDELRAMKFSLTERKQVKEDELHYFDNPWFGSIVRITRYTGEEDEVITE